jgi:hypothetical protein
MEGTLLQARINPAPRKFASGPRWRSVYLKQPGRGNQRRVWMQVAVLSLLVMLAGLATFAKYTPYLPKTSPSHYVNNATKLKVVQSSVLHERAPLLPIAMVVPSRPEYRARRTDVPVAPPIELIGLTVSRQHRSPPPTLA